MLGRLIDQIFTTHVESPEDADHAHHFMSSLGRPSVPHSYVWGDVKDEILNADLRILNLETSVTTNDQKWPDKVFNYRMHPNNVACLREINADFCSLANNHTLDFGYKGMSETIQTLKAAGIHYAGVGKNIDEAMKPAVFSFGPSNQRKTIACFSAADHPGIWAASSNKPGIAYVDVDNFDDHDIDRFTKAIMAVRSEVDLVSVSLHWGSNYCWNPSAKFQQFAHQLIDAGADLIHGHSSHHVQGIEIYKGKPIMYGLGDFVDDYAVEREYRNNLGFIYKLQLDPSTNKFTSIEMVPTTIKLFQVHKTRNPKDLSWQLQVMSKLCERLHTGTTTSADNHLHISL